MLRHDILTGSVPDLDGFDVAHCRALLLHLADPLLGLHNMLSGLRPGARVLLEDADFATLVAADPTHPASPVFDPVFAAVMDMQARLGTLDQRFGRSLLPLAQRVGLVNCRQEAIAMLRWGGSGEAELLRISCGAAQRALLDRQLLSEADLGAWTVALGDPEFCFYDALSVAVWGEMPRAR